MNNTHQKRQWTAENATSKATEQPAKKDTTPQKKPAPRYEDDMGFEEIKSVPATNYTYNNKPAETKPTATQQQPVSTSKPQTPSFTSQNPTPTTASAVAADQQQSSAQKKPNAFKGPSFNPLMKRSSSNDSAGNNPTTTPPATAPAQPVQPASSVWQPSPSSAFPSLNNQKQSPFTYGSSAATKQPVAQPAPAANPLRKSHESIVSEKIIVDEYSDDFD